MASLAVAFAMIAPKITSTIIEAQEFTDIASRYAVMGVPRTVVNEDVDGAIEGAVPADVLLQKILEA